MPREMSKREKEEYISRFGDDWIPEDETDTFTISPKGERWIKKYKESAEGDYSPLDYAFLQSAKAGVLIRNNIRVRYGSVGLRRIRELVVEGLIN